VLSSVAHIPSRRRSYGGGQHRPLRSDEEGITGVQARAVQHHHSLAEHGLSRPAPPLPMQGAQSHPPLRSKQHLLHLQVSLPSLTFSLFLSLCRGVVVSGFGVVQTSLCIRRSVSGQENPPSLLAMNCLFFASFLLVFTSVKGPTVVCSNPRYLTPCNPVHVHMRSFSFVCAG
jgi:hypothetical protein